MLFPYRPTLFNIHLHEQVRVCSVSIVPPGDITLVEKLIVIIKSDGVSTDCMIPKGMALGIRKAIKLRYLDRS